MDIWRQKTTQLELAFPTGGRGEASRPAGEGTEMLKASHETESPTSNRSTRETLNQPNRRVRTRTHGGVTGKAREGLPISINDQGK
jgi:hypothetical protein